MRRTRQYFRVEDEAVEALPIAASPWHIGPMAKVPSEHWNLIVDFAESFSSTYASLLRSWSGDVMGKHIEASPEELGALIEFLGELRRHAREGPSLSPHPTGEILEDYTREDHEQMIYAVQAVLEEALRRGKAIFAWRHP